MNDNYIELNLIEVNDNGQIRYFAVNDDTEDNMFHTESALSYSTNPLLRNIKMRRLGVVSVQEQG